MGWVDPLGLNGNKNPNNWLQHHEGGSHNGHTIDRHVGKQDCELKSRLDNSKTQKMPKGISGSGSYPNQKVAENTISKAFKQVNPDTGNTNKKDLKEWAKFAPMGKTTYITYSGKDVIGRGILRGETKVINRIEAQVVVRKTGYGKYSILTSYPR